MDKKKTAISLFSGAGGMDVGFEKAGIQVLVANEIMPEASETYKANHQESRMINDDINNVINELDKYSGVDFVFGGPPCQGFSVAGKMDPDDSRSKLIFTFLDVIKKVRPKAFVMENVKALAKLEKWGDVRKRYLDTAAMLGYQCLPFVLNATEFNVSQKRERVFFVGVRDNSDIFFEYHMNELLDEEKKKAPIIRDLLKDLGKAGTDKNPNTCTAKITFATHPIMRKSPYAGMYFNGQGRPINIDGYANTLPASMGGNKTPFVDEEYLYGKADEDWVVKYHKGLLDGSITPQFEEAPKRLRRLTINEAIRIQTFPDDYIFCGNKGKIYTQIGNELEKWGDVRKRYLDTAAMLGYQCLPFVLNATEFNVSQKRERVFFVGVRDNSDIFFEYHMNELLDEEKKKAPIIRDLLKDLGKAGTDKNPNTCTAKITFATHPIMRKSPYAGMYFNGQGRPINIDGYANTLPASMGGNKTPFVDEEYLYGKADEDWVVKYHKGLLDGSITPQFEEAPKRLRRLTINEAIRIQTFPDDYIFCGNKGKIYTQIGNAVPCNLAEAVAKATLKYMEKYE